jgi:hypothetical protein
MLNHPAPIDGLNYSRAIIIIIIHQIGLYLQLLADKRAGVTEIILTSRLSNGVTRV